MFHFTLQTVLDVRKRLEKIKYKEFSEVLFEWQKLDTEIKERHAQIELSGKRTDQVRLAGLTTMSLQMYDHYKQRLRNEIELYEEQQREHEQSLEEKRRELVEARRAHRALEILKEKELKRYEMEQNRQERTIMDEVSSNYHFRSKKQKP